MKSRVPGYKMAYAEKLHAWLAGRCAREKGE